MYCSTCGVALAKGLSFCNYCGAKLPSTEATLEFREVRPQLLVSAMAGVFVLGLPGITFLIFMLNAVRLDSGQMMALRGRAAAACRAGSILRSASVTAQATEGRATSRPSVQGSANK